MAGFPAMEPGEFKGVIGRYAHEATPWWAPEPSAREGAPNVVIDDVGFAQLGCYGSPIDTPNLDRLAAGGLRYRSFHTTALCSPTRSCVLTGRNHHANGMGRVTDLAMGFPGYDARIPKANGMLPAMLVPEGYAAYAVGKWHLTPEEDTHLGARRDRWPLGRGFERWYGFFGGETHQFAPALYYDNHSVDPPLRPGYHLTQDLVDHGIEFVRDLRAVDDAKPFFLYLATGACHSPHQAPEEWRQRFRGRFDAGWDVYREETFARQLEMGVLPAGTELSPRPEWVPAWAELSERAQRVYARYMEAFAAFLSHADDQIGRLVHALDDLGDLDNTLLLVLSDNGASSEGGPTGSLNDARPWNGLPRSVTEAVEHIDEIGGPRWHTNYPWGWTVAGNTPFRRWKREVHEGGVADPLIVHWPAGIRRSDADTGVRSQYVHAIDLVPTILDVCGIDPPATIAGVEQTRIHGVSFAATFTDPDAAEARTTQYFEMLGCQAIYHEGWKAVTYHPIQDAEPGLDKVAWELYHVAVDASECHDLAADHPEKVDELIALWWAEAERYGALPLDNRAFSELVIDRPQAVAPRERYVYHPGTGPVPEGAMPSLKQRSHTITAVVDVPAEGASGALLVVGSNFGGFSFHAIDGRLVYEHNLAGWQRARITADGPPVGPGHHELAFRYRKGDGFSGAAELLVDGQVVGAGEIPFFTPFRFSITDAGLTCGYARALPPTDDYDAPFPFTGTLHRVVVTLDGPASPDDTADVEIAIARQ